MRGENNVSMSAPVWTWRAASWIYGCFFFSGALGLIYEVLWTRLLGLVFGHTVFAITTVLTAFMAGLGLGSYLFGRIVDRGGNLLRLYGVLEVGIGIYGVIIPLLFGGAEKVYLALFNRFQLSLYKFSLLQFTLIFFILLIPTTLMGGTLPILGRFFTREAGIAGRKIGMLYTLNTFGAVAGTFAVGFYLLPLIGVKATLALAVASSVGIGLFILFIERRLAASPGGSASAGRKAEALDPTRALPASGGAPASLVFVYILLGFGLSGAASMMYEVGWTRVLSLIIGSSTYAFTSMLIAFLAGLALGSWILARYLRSRNADPIMFSLLQLGIGASALLLLPLLERMPVVFIGALRLSSSPQFLLGVQFFISLLSMLVPTLLMGATFPCAVQILSRGLDRIGYDVGMIYSVNTLGAIVGAFSAGFFLIPTLGVQSTLKVATAINLLVAAAVIMTWRRGSWSWRKGVAVLTPLLSFVVLLAVPQWDKRVMSMGPAIYGRRYASLLGKVGLREMAGAHLLFYRDGISSTVSVHREDERLLLKVNGKTDAGTGGDMPTQLLLGHLPLFFHPAARDILVIGLGSGVTVGAITQHPVRNIKVVEIEPAVVEAAAFFNKYNRNALADPRVELVIADGRNVLRSTDKKYDVITSEPSNPWIKGVANLFSLEFYQLAKERLNTSGLFCQWVQGYDMHPEDLRMVVNTFRSVFPHTTVWNPRAGDFLLIGTGQPIALDYQKLSTQFHMTRGLREDMERLGMRAPEALIADFVLGEVETARYVAGARLNTDDLPLLEFSAPLGLYAGPTLELNLNELKRFRVLDSTPPMNLSEDIKSSARFQYDLGMAFLAKGTKEEKQVALDRFNAALAIDPKHVPSLLALGDVHLDLKEPGKAEKSFQAALKLNPKSAGAHVGLAKVYRNELALAIDHLKRAVALEPNDPSHRWLLGEAYRSAGRFKEAISCYLAVQEVRGRDVRFLRALADAYILAGQESEGIKVLTDALVEDPQDEKTRVQLGAAYIMAKEYDRAEQQFRAALTFDPMCPACYVGLGGIHLLRRERQQAARFFRKALSLDPSNPAARRGLEELANAPS